MISRRFLTVLCVLVALRAPAAGKERARDRVDALIEEARQLEDEALRYRGRDERERASLFRRAVSVLERALEVEGRHVEARVALARVLSNADLGDEALRRSVRELSQARKDDSLGVFECEIAQILGIVLSRLSRFEDAVREYDRAIALLPGQPGSPLRQRSHHATMLGNSAEALMALGRLDEAIARYTRAEAMEMTDQVALHTLGLAVAYDRDGQIEKSREALWRSLTTDPAMKLFQSDSVFFVPPGDRHYYVALIAEAFADQEGAVAAWEGFLRELPQSRYASRAREHLAELRRTPGLSPREIQRAHVELGVPLFPPERESTSPLDRRLRDEDEIERIAHAHRSELKQCYARALRVDERLRGDIDVALVLDRNGAVALAEVMRSSLGERSGTMERDSQGQAARDLQRCVVDFIRRWRFPAAEVDHDEMALPLRFTVKR